MTARLVAYRIKRDDCDGWLFAGQTPTEVADTLRDQLHTHEGLPADECDTITVEAYETTQAEIDALPEFSGW